MNNARALDDETAQPATRRHRVVIIGGGFGGVRAAKALAKAPVDITLIDRMNHHVFQPLLYQVATAALSAGEIAPALRSLFRKEPHVRVMLGNVADIDLDGRVVHADSGYPLELAYDTLIVAAGATHSYFGRDEWAEYAGGMKTLDDAYRLRSRILGAYELAETATDTALRDELLTFAVVGGGPTGVELAGQLATLADRTFRGEYRAIDPKRARVVLVEAGPALLGPFAPKLREAALNDLRHMGVEVLLSHSAEHVDETGIEVKGPDGKRHIASKTVIWAAGVKASPLATLLAEKTGASIDRSGRLTVQPDCSLAGHPEVFAIGDMIAMKGVPGVAQPAIQQGKYVARVIRARLAGDDPPSPFHYRDLGSMAVIGRMRAVATIGGYSFHGIFAFLIWAFIHLVYLVGWERRVETVLRWVGNLVTRHRAERLISVTSLVSEERARAELAARLDATLGRTAPVPPVPMVAHAVASPTPS